MGFSRQHEADSKGEEGKGRRVGKASWGGYNEMAKSYLAKSHFLKEQLLPDYLRAQASQSRRKICNT